MSSPDLIYQGLELALIGMGTVFTFLTILVLSTLLMSWCVRRFAQKDGFQPAGAVGAGARGEDSGEVVAAIAAALRLHRSR